MTCECLNEIYGHCRVNANHIPSFIATFDSIFGKDENSSGANRSLALIIMHNRHQLIGKLYPLRFALN